MSAFSGTGLLGELEQLVLLAARQLGDRAYAVSIRDEIDPTPARGGKAKRYFRVTAAGERALAAAERAVTLMRTPRRAPAER
jgi:hypothetical protein